MKHLYEYDDQVVDNLMKNLDRVGQGHMKGWIIAVVPFDQDGSNVGTSYYAVVAETIEEGFNMLLDYATPEPEDPLKFETWEELLEKISDLQGWDYGDKFLAAWKGLTPRVNTPKVEKIRRPSPFEVISELDKYFINVQSIMVSNPNGNT
jgi:hypothetical protein